MKKILNLFWILGILLPLGVSAQQAEQMPKKAQIPVPRQMKSEQKTPADKQTATENYVFIKAAPPVPQQPGSPKGSENVSSKWNPVGGLFLLEYESYEKNPSKDPQIRKRLEEAYGLCSHSLGSKAAADYLPVILEYESPAALRKAVKAGFLPNIVLEKTCTGLLPLSKRKKIENIEEILRISASLRMSVQNDSSRLRSRVDQIQENAQQNGLKQAYTGNGVVVGVIDIGFDYTHPTFFGDPSKQETYRVSRVWDQISRGTPPQGYSNGKELIGKDAILAAKHDSYYNSQDHGTHVAGTAAGGGGGTAYKGMAYESEIVLVSSTLLDPDILNGIKYIMDYAESVGKPCVINMSLGSDIGPHDGTSGFDRLSDQLSRSGAIMVASAGNSGGKGCHYMLEESVYDDGYKGSYLYPETADNFYIDLWSFDSTAMQVYMELTNIQTGESWGKIIQKEGKDTINLNHETVVSLSVESELNARNNKYEVLIGMDLTNKFNPSDFKVFLTAINAHDPEKPLAGYHAWVNSGTAYFSPAVDSFTHSGSIASSKSILSVAAYASRVYWETANEEYYSYPDQNSHQICPFSGRGPLTDGTVKPDIAAPGSAIVSSGSSFLEHAYYYVVENTELNGRTYPWIVKQGTSMAAPAVTGMVALLLERDPSLDIERLKTLISQTAHTDDFTGNTLQTKSSIWGYGKFDALEAMLSDEINTDSFPSITIRNEEGGSITATYNGSQIQSGAKLKPGSTIELRAKAEQNYEFVRWWDNDTENGKTLVLTQDTVVSAYFKEKTANETPQAEKWNLYPNPSSGIFHLNGFQDARITVFTPAGISVAELEYKAGESQAIDLGPYPSGIYYVKIECQDRNTTLKAVRQ